MIAFREPRTADIRDFLNDNALSPFSYPDLGCTRGRNVPGFNTDRMRIELGSGDLQFEKAKRAVRDWREFSIDWVRLCWPYKRLVPGTVVAILTHHFGFYAVNAARIVYVVDQPKRFGLGLGTLAEHIVRGEMLLVVYQEDDGRVFFEVSAISRPSHWLSWLFYPLGRRLQSRFFRDSLHAALEAMLTMDLRKRQEMAPEGEEQG